MFNTLHPQKESSLLLLRMEMFPDALGRRHRSIHHNGISSPQLLHKGCASSNNSSWKHQKSQTLTFKEKNDMITWMSLHNAHDAIRVKEWCFLSPKDRLRLRLPWFRRMTPLDVHLYNLPTAEKAKPLSWIEWKTGQNPKNLPFPSLSKTNFLNFSTSNVMPEIFRMRVHHIISYCTAQDTFFTTLSVEHGWTSSSANTFLLLQMWHLLAIDQIDPLSHLLHAPQPPWMKCTNSIQHIQHIDFTV